jgi:hypothetical protein
MVYFFYECMQRMLAEEDDQTCLFDLMDCCCLVARHMVDINRNHRLLAVLNCSASVLLSLQ